ncbi:hypothetical protein OQ968_08605 [Mycobacterium sp. 663a-19]|uniref:hypothetical protein n=1 Tax=Mycobacterium sp. 663a-19 TaxID=2986148 RepID=UPI002D1E9317|nr:hypothetical protein [Mycobacterium sp. 663a-19]MEB3981319.1 hypothetical protein [Mycobacterium sp. 663a-19]
MSKLRFAIVATVAAVSAIAVALGTGTARADPPAPGDGCTVLHATAKDANGRMMWCNPTMTGDHSLVWQYGGPA